MSSSTTAFQTSNAGTPVWRRLFVTGCNAWRALTIQTLALGLVAAAAWFLGTGLLNVFEDSGAVVRVGDGFFVLPVGSVLYGPAATSMLLMGCVLSSVTAQLALQLSALGWNLLVCAVFGSAICRSVAVRLSSDRTPDWREVFQFTLPRTLQSWLAPFLPLAICYVLILVRYLCGGLTWLPWVGAAVYAALWWAITALVCILLVLTAVGWPLMFAAQATELSDCFDGVSRAVNFVLTRPFHYLAALASVLMIGFLPAQLGKFVGMLLLDGNVVAAWPEAVITVLCAGPATAVFFTWATLTFLELRHQIDATEVDEVYVPGGERTEPVPLVGRSAHPVTAE